MDSSTARRQEILQRRLREKQLADESTPRRPPPRNHPERAPLSFAQRRMWLHQQINPGSHAYNVTILLTLSGAIDRAKLETALAGVVDSQEILRTTYHVDDSGMPYQHVHPHRSLPLRFADVSATDGGHRPDHVRQLAAEDARRPFDLSGEDPVRFLLVRSADDELALALTVHHIIWDGLSFAALCRDLSSLYRQARAGADTSLPVHPTQYADFAEWEQRNWSEAEHADRLAFWRRQLDGASRPPLPLRRADREGIDERAGRVDRRMPQRCGPGLRSIAAAQRTTTFIVFLTCYLLVLHRYTGATGITVGTTSMNREQPGVQGLIGNFGNTLALPFDLSGDPDLPALVRRVRDVWEAAHQHQDYPFELLVERLRPAKQADKPVLFDALALFLAAEVEGPDLPDVQVHWETVFHGATAFPLSVQAFLTDRGLDVEATYAAERFDHEVVSQLVDALGEIVQRAVDEPQARVSRLAALSESARTRLRDLGTGEPLAVTASAPELFAQQVRRRPDATALIAGDRHVSYAQLEARADAITRQLRGLGVGPGSSAAIAVPRSAEMVLAVLGVLRAGAAYVPVDPAYPAERVAYMLRDSNPAAVLTTAATAHELPEGPWPRVLLDDPAAEHHRAETAGVPGPAVPPDLSAAAWVGYTSGSTGTPKGVVCTHLGLAARVLGAQRHWPVADAEPRLAKSSLTFIDGSTEILETLCAGGTLVLADDAQRSDGAAVSRLLGAHRIRHLMAVPSLLRGMADVPGGALAEMIRVISTGEPLPAALAGDLGAQLPSGALANSYGCSELTGDVVTGPVDGGSPDAVPVGLPAPGTSAYVLDERLRLVPEGVVGDLYIGGPQLARGYHDRPGLTAQRFVADPFGSGSRLYWTGDLARWCAGALELVGRRDDQVKIRGHRVEPGELTAVARALPPVREAATVPRPGPVGSTQLVLYVTPREVSVDDLRARLERALPAHLRPATIVPLPELPLLPNGKVDRSALPEPGPALPAQRTTPRTERERRLCDIIASLLESAEAGPDDDFFALGGDSMSAMLLVTQARRAGLSFEVHDVFEYRTAGGLAAAATDTVPSGPERIGEEPVTVPLPPAAHRLRRSGFPPKDYVSSTWWFADPGTDTPALENTLRAAVARHAALRVQVDTTRRGLWRATLLPQAGEWPHAELITDLPQDSDAARVDALTDVATRRLDLSTGRTLHGVLAPGTSDSGPIIVLAAHGLTVDARSLETLRAEINASLTGDETDAPATDWPEHTGDAQPEQAHRWAELLRDATAGPAEWAAPPATHRRNHVRTRIPGRLDDHTAAATWLHVLRRWLGARKVVCDHLLPHAGSTGVRPLAGRHPMSATDADSPAELARVCWELEAKGRTYEHLRYAAPQNSRTFAELAEPHVLFARGLVPAPESGVFSYHARGPERLYHLVAAFDDTGADATDLDLAAPPDSVPLGTLESLLTEWRDALTRYRGYP